MAADWFGYAVLLLLALGLGTLLAGVLCLALAVVRGGRRLVGNLRDRAGQSAVAAPASPPYVYLACHTTICGHMHTRHYPAGPGLLMCGGCHATVAEV
jgi:hypothetical protein